MSQFIESIKVKDGKIFLLELHQERVKRTFTHFSSDKVLNIKSIFESLNHDDDRLFKFRIVYDLEGNFQTQLLPYAVATIENFELIENNMFDYSFKFKDRSELQKMLTKAKAKEIIIVKNSCITDTSFSNLLFKKNNAWFTPKTFLLNGVQRTNLLQTMEITEAEITLDNIKEYSHFQIINAMNGFDETSAYPLSKITNLPQNPEFSEY